MKTSAHGRKFIETFETFVPHVYDDARPPVKGKYREWDGGDVHGTLTIGYGHTNAAAHPLKICHGLRIDEAKADEVLSADLEECEEQVNRLADEGCFSLSQGQFDALISFTFNCGIRNTRLLVSPLKLRGDHKATREKFALYVRSKGREMKGLVRRRKGEQALWDEKRPALPKAVVHHPAEVYAPLAFEIPAAQAHDPSPTHVVPGHSATPVPAPVPTPVPATHTLTMEEVHAIGRDGPHDPHPAATTKQTAPANKVSGDSVAKKMVEGLFVWGAIIFGVGWFLLKFFG